MEASKPTSRRTFLRLASLGAAGTALLAACNAPAAPTSAPTTAPTAPTTAPAAPTTAPAAATPASAGATPTTAAAAKPTAAATPAAQPAASTGQAVELTFSNWNDDTYGRFREEEKVALFNKKYPNVKINMRLFRTNYQETLVTQLAGGVGADVFRLDIPNIWPMADQGAIPDISSRMRDKENWYATPDCLRDLFDALLYKGKFYAIATAVDSNSLEVNQSLFDADKVPHLAQSYTDKNYDVGVVLDAAKRLTKREGNTPTQFGINSPLDDSWQYLPFIWAMGGTTISEDKTKLMWDQEKPVKALQFLADLINVHKVAPAPAGGDAKTFGYDTGKLAMAFSYPSQLVYRYRAKLTWDWQLAPEPPDLGLQPRTSTAYNAWTMNAKSKHPDEAWQYLSFLAGPVATQVDVELGWASPLFKSLREVYYKRVLADNPNKNVKPGVEAFDNIQGWYDPHMHPAWAEAESKIVQPALDEVAIGKNTAANAVKAIKPQVDKLLAEGAKKLNP